jgi:hypothetical protein
MLQWRDRVGFAPTSLLTRTNRFERDLLAFQNTLAFYIRRRRGVSAIVRNVQAGSFIDYRANPIGWQYQVLSVIVRGTGEIGI